MSQSTNTKHNGYFLPADYGTRIEIIIVRGCPIIWMLFICIRDLRWLWVELRMAVVELGSTPSESALLFIPWLVDRMHSLLESPQLA